MPKTKILIAFDPGGNLGYAVFDVAKYCSTEILGGLKQHGCSKRHNQEGKRGKWKRIRGLCDNLLKIYDPKRYELSIVAEEQFYYPRMATTLATSIGICGQTLGGLKMIFAAYPFETVSVQAWQGALLSKSRGKDSKEKSIETVRILTGLHCVTDDEADAILIGVYYLDHLGFAQKVKEATA